MCYIEFEDGSAANDVAYDYVATYVGAGNAESVFSTPALGTPVGRPVGFTACIEDLHTKNITASNYKEGAGRCAIGLPITRLALRWHPPSAPAYQPFAATNADGTLGYLKGFRVYRYRTSGLSSTTEDKHILTPETFDFDKNYCTASPGTTCGWGGPGGGEGSVAGICPSADTCQVPQFTRVGNNWPPHGTCGGGGSWCITDLDCTNGQSCKDAPSDPYISLYRDDGLNTFMYSNDGGDCLAVKAVHKVFANGNWLTVESDFSDNFDVSQLSSQSLRCKGRTPDSCVYYGAKCASPASEFPPPPPVAKPSVASNAPGEVTVSWTPPAAGVCQLTYPATCFFSGCAPFDPDCADCPDPSTQVCEYCPPGEYCPTGGKCVLRNPAPCDTTVPASCAANQTCTARPYEAYYLYAMEPAGSQTQRSYHFRPSSPAVRVERSATCPSDPSKICYTFKGLSPRFGRGSNLTPDRFSFRVSTAAAGGRASDPSPVSDQIVPAGSGLPIPAPASVKTVIWTVNDAIRDTSSLVTQTNPRDLNGIKISWRPGGTYTGLQGYHVWRRDDQAGAQALVGTTNTETTIYLDTTAQSRIAYNYTVTAFTTGGSESPESPMVEGVALPHANPPLSPPLYVKAKAASTFTGVFVTWCKNPSQEGVTSYKVYRGRQPGGPYIFLAEIPLGCVDGSHRCNIASIGTTPTPDSNCTTGINGSCRVVDMTVANAANGGTLVDEVQNYLYSYVVTAVRDPGGGQPRQESGYSVENQGWPNYCTGSSCVERYDPDNFPDIACGDEQASLRDGAGAQSTPHAADGLAPYRYVAGPPICSDGCGGGPPPEPKQPPAAPRLIFFHLDHLGSPRVITESGAIISTHRYMPFGEEFPVQAQNSTNTRQFTGHERDGESGLDYMMARYYTTPLDRFVAVDRIRGGNSPSIPQRWNGYSYASNNPLARIDPDGLADIYIGGLGDKAFSHIVKGYEQNQQGKGRATKYFAWDEGKKAIKYANKMLKKGEPVNIIGHSWGAGVAPLVAAGVKGKVSTLVGIDPVGLPNTFGMFGRPGNVETVVTVMAQPSSPNWSDIVADYGRDQAGLGGVPQAFSSEADVTMTVDMNHEQFASMFEFVGPDGLSAKDIVDQTYAGAGGSGAGAAGAGGGGGSGGGDGGGSSGGGGGQTISFPICDCMGCRW